jgi:hypothetical protein
VESKPRAPKGSDGFEAFISDMEMTMKSLALEEDNDYKPNTRVQEIKDIATQLSKNDCVIIPAYKTNSFTAMPMNEHKHKFSTSSSRMVKKFQGAGQSKLTNKQLNSYKKSADSALQEKESSHKSPSSPRQFLLPSY